MPNINLWENGLRITVKYSAKILIISTCSDKMQLQKNRELRTLNIVNKSLFKKTPLFKKQKKKHKCFILQINRNFRSSF